MPKGEAAFDFRTLLSADQGARDRILAALGEAGATLAETAATEGADEPAHRATLEDGSRLVLNSHVWTEPGCFVSGTTLGMRTFFMSRRMPASARVQRDLVCSRILSTRYMAGIVPEGRADLGPAATEAIRMAAEATRALLYSGDALHDWRGKLALDLAGRFDEEAMPPLFWLVYATNGEAIKSAAAKARGRLPEVELSVFEMGGAEASGLRFGSAVDMAGRCFAAAPPAGKAEARRRIGTLQPLFCEGRSVAMLMAPARENGRRARELALQLASAVGGLASDGFSLFDPAGRIAWSRNGDFDADAGLPNLKG